MKAGIPALAAYTSVAERVAQTTTHPALLTAPLKPVTGSLTTIDHDENHWTAHVAAFSSGWHRVLGTPQDLLDIAERLGQQWWKGVRLALTLG